MGASRPLRCDGGRLWTSLMSMAAVGATDDGGCCRLALSDEDAEARQLFEVWCRAAGLATRSDQIGNLFARRPGTDPSADPVMLGSHLDTVPKGGRFDGAYGVLAALEVIRALDDAGLQTVAPIDVAVWANEEGARFPEVCTGSGVFAGALTIDHVRALVAADGASYGEELDRRGLAGDERPSSVVPAAYLEAHIEQGPMLERTGATIGVVKGIRPVRYFEVIFDGQEAHAGSPMEGRRDALRAAARCVEALHSFSTPALNDAIVAVGRLDVEPNAPGVVASRVRSWICIRPVGLTGDDSWLSDVETTFRALAGELGVTMSIRPVSRYGPVVFDPKIVATVRAAARTLGLEALDIVSTAGHDAGYLARAAPTAMVFVPCRAGLSHHPDEFAKPADLALGCDVLMDATVRLAGTA